MWLHDRPSAVAQKRTAVQSLSQIALANALTRDFADSGSFAGSSQAADVVHV
jgi:hypothetical protein